MFVLHSTNIYPSTKSDAKNIKRKNTQHFQRVYILVKRKVMEMNDHTVKKGMTSRKRGEREQAAGKHREDLCLSC